MPEAASPNVRRRRLAAELRRLRERADLTGDQVAERTGFSASKISRIENAHTAPRASEVSKLLEVYGVEGEAADALITLAEEAAAARKGWWDEYSQTLPPGYADLIGMEAEAQSALSWAAQVVPGLLQTEDYARAVTNEYLERIITVPPSETQRRVEARLARQQVLTQADPLRLSVVLDESVLRRKFGARATMHSQITQLLDLSERDNISIRILPLDGRHPIGTGAFVLLQFDDTHAVTYQDVVYVEHLTGSLYIEGEEETYRYRRSFEHLFELAFKEPESRKMLVSARDAWK